MKLLKSYFNMFFNKGLEMKKLKNLLKIRRFSPKKIFIGKGELKHTNSKVIITFYVYNTEKISLKREYENLYKNLYFSQEKQTVTNKLGYIQPIYKENTLKRYIGVDNEGNIAKDKHNLLNITYNRPYTIKEFLASYNKYSTYYSKESRLKLIDYHQIYCFVTLSLLDKVTNYIKIFLKFNEYLTRLVNANIIKEHEKLTIFTRKTEDYYAFEYPKYNYYTCIAENKYRESLYKLRYLLKLNDIKFEKPFIGKLTRLVEKLYSKQVEFNIVNLKKLHLNSDIFTQAVTLKLKNRKNKLFNVLRSSLSKIKLPDANKRKYSYKNNREEYLINKIRNMHVNSMVNKETLNSDSLNNLLKSLFSPVNGLDLPLKSNVYSITLKKYLFGHLKHLKLAGIRVEAKGRLTRRFTASRSLFKVKWKGGLKNVDSSFKGLSTVMLRGNTKSNLQYSNFNSSNKIGAFGVKGWISNV